MTEKKGRTRLGQTAIAALERYEQEKNGTRPSHSHTPTPRIEQPTPPASSNDIYPFATRPRSSVKTAKRRRSRLAFMPSWRAMMNALIPTKTKPNLSGMKAKAALARHAGEHVAPRMTPPSRPQKPSLLATTKKIVSDFHVQSVAFATRHGHALGQAAFAVALFAVMATSISTPSFSTASAIDNDTNSGTTIAAPSSLSIAPLVVVDGSMNDAPQDAPTPDTQTDPAPLPTLEGTPKVPVAPTFALQQTGRVKVTFNAPAYVAKSQEPIKLTTQSKKLVTKSQPAQKTVAQFQAEAIHLFLDAKIKAGRMDNADANKKALATYLNASSAAQRGGIMANPVVQRGHADLALLYTGAPGIPQSLHNAANILKVSDRTCPSAQRVLKKIQIENPLLYQQMQNHAAKAVIEDAQALRPTTMGNTRIRALLNPADRTVHVLTAY